MRRQWDKRKQIFVRVRRVTFAFQTLQWIRHEFWTTWKDDFKADSCWAKKLIFCIIIYMLSSLKFTRVKSRKEPQNVYYLYLRQAMQNSCLFIGFEQARSQKFAMGGLFGGSGGGASSCRRPMGVWGRSPQLPEAGGLGAKPPAAGGTGAWGRSPQRSKILHFFAKITSF